MNKRVISLGLLLVIVFQSAVLAGEYLNAVYPLWTGEEIRLKTRPVDPRSIFRGNYARLRYDISSVPTSAFSEPLRLRNEESVYVRLKRDGDGLYVYDGASLNRPESGVFIRGRLKTHRYSQRADIEVKYGIEAWFAPKDKALQLERELRSSAVAVVMVAANGKATLKAIESKSNSGN